MGNDSKMSRKIKKTKGSRAEDMPNVYKLESSDVMCELLEDIQNRIIAGKSLYINQLRGKRVKVESFGKHTVKRGKNENKK